MFRSAAVFSILSTTVAFRQVARFGSAKPLSMALKESESIPNVVFKARVRDEKIGGSNPFTWKDITTSDLFKGKRSVVFALPGGVTRLLLIDLHFVSIPQLLPLFFTYFSAFTPTCSSTHLPGYEKHYGMLISPSQSPLRQAAK